MFGSVPLSLTMDVDSDKSSSSSFSFSSSPSCASEEEIEAAETLAHLALRHADDRCCTTAANNAIRHSPTPHTLIAPAGQGVAGQQQLDEKMEHDDCLGPVKVEQDAAELPTRTTTCHSSVRCSKSRRNLTEEEKEARRIRRVLANRESARQTIRRRQALSEELTRKAATLVMENENLKREKELALKEYQSLETTNKHLKAQIAKSINTEVQKTPVEQESSVAEVAPVSGNSPWFLYNHFPVTQLFWPSILQSPSPVQLQHTPFNSIAIPPNVYVPCSSESESHHKQNNLIDNRTQNPLYMFPCPWLHPLPEFGNGQSPPSTSLKDKLDKPPGKNCRTSLSLNTAANVDYQPAPPIKLKTEASGLTEARSVNGPVHATPSFSLDGGEQKSKCHIVEKFRRPALGCNGHASAVKQEPELQLHSAPNTKASSTASHTAASSLEREQEQFTSVGQNLVDAVAAGEARKRRKELTKLKSIHNRQSRMEC